VALQPASKIGHPAKGKIWLSVNGTERQQGDLTELIWSVPEIIAKLSEQVALGAGDIILTGTPGRGRRTLARRQNRMRGRWHRHPQGHDQPAGIAGFRARMRHSAQAVRR